MMLLKNSPIWLKNNNLEELLFRDSLKYQTKKNVLSTWNMIWSNQRMFRLITTTRMILMISQTEAIHLSWHSVRRVSHIRPMVSFFKRELKLCLKTKSKKSNKSRRNRAKKTRKKWSREISWSKSQLHLMNLSRSIMSVFHTKETLMTLLPMDKTCSITEDTQSRGTMKLTKKLWKLKMKSKLRRI